MKLFYAATTAAIAMLCMIPFSKSASASVIVQHARTVNVAERPAAPASRPTTITRVNEPTEIIRRTTINNVNDPTEIVRRTTINNMVEPVAIEPIPAFDPFYYPVPAVNEIQVNLPIRTVDPTVWQNSQMLYSNSGWTQMTLPVGQYGSELELHVQGEPQLSYAQVHFGDGQIETINLQNQTYNSGSYPMLNFGRSRYVQSVNFEGRSQTSSSDITLSLKA